MEITRSDDIQETEPIETVEDVQPVDTSTIYYIWRESDNRYMTYQYEEPEHARWTLAKPPQFTPAQEFPYWDSLQESWYLKSVE